MLEVRSTPGHTNGMLMSQAPNIKTFLDIFPLAYYDPNFFPTNNCEVSQALYKHQHSQSSVHATSPCHRDPSVKTTSGWHRETGRRSFIYMIVASNCHAVYGK